MSLHVSFLTITVEEQAERLNRLKRINVILVILAFPGRLAALLTLNPPYSQWKIIRVDRKKAEKRVNFAGLSAKLLEIGLEIRT
jgi:hypothetical protein